jgi:hypothetical protein
MISDGRISTGTTYVASALALHLVTDVTAKASSGRHLDSWLVKELVLVLVGCEDWKMECRVG